MLHIISGELSPPQLSIITLTHVKTAMIQLAGLATLATPFKEHLVHVT